MPVVHYGMTVRVPKIMRKFTEIVKDEGYECYLVGGAVRDLVMGGTPVDYDVATNASPEEVMRIFRRSIPTGIDHGTVTVLFQDSSIEVTTYRVEGKYSDSRHPDTVSFTAGIDTDIQRRDFTVNGLALDCLAGTVIDIVDGISDLRNRTIKAIGDPHERFKEDALRILRACRFSSQLEFSIESETLRAMSACREKIRAVSPERIQGEFGKILSSRLPSIALNYMDTTRILDVVFPELAECRGVEQGDPHRFDVLGHSIAACDGAPRENPVVRLAALLHDIGKPRARVENPDGTITFHRHEATSAEMASALLTRLKFPKAVIQGTTHLISGHMWSYSEDWTDSAVRRFIRRTGADALDDTFLLRRADTYGMTGTEIRKQEPNELQERIAEVLKAGTALTIKDLSVDGEILHTESGIPKGPEMGIVMRELLEMVTDDPSLNTRDRLVTIAKAFYEERMR